MQKTNARVIDEDLKERSSREYRWMVWLLKVWDDNEKKPSWLMVKRNWPEEYQSILRDVGPWDVVERKLDVVREIKEQNAEKKVMRELQVSHALQPSQRTYTPEQCILGLLRLMKHLQIDRLPTMSEIDRHSKELGVPRASTYTRTMVTKDNWAPCIRKYQAASPEERESVVHEIEVDLAKQRLEKWRNTPGRGEQKVHSMDDCLETVRKIYEEFGCIPTRQEVCRYVQEHNLVRTKTLYSHLGNMDKWPEQLTEYLTRLEAEKFLQNYGSLRVQGTLSIDSLLEKAQKAASVTEEMEWAEVVGRIRKSSKKKPAVFEFEFEGHTYEAKVVRK